VFHDEGWNMHVLAQHLKRVGTFGSVGAVGFLVEAAVLSSLTAWAQWTPWQARVPSFGFAVLATWLLNRHITFRHQRRSNSSREALLYFGTQSVGAAINLVIFGAALQASSTMESLPVLALGAGAVGGFVFNYLVSATLIYSTDTRS